MSDRDHAPTAERLRVELAETVESPAPRAVLAQRYELLGLLGAGAMGTVYRAHDRELDETVALKVLKKELAASAGIVERFRSEVKLARRVTHRNVARMFDIGEDAGDRFLTMELVDGESLADRLATVGRMPPRDVVAIAKDVCAGLACAHDAGVIHRDLKPDNVMLTTDGRAVITDFGIARALIGADRRTAAGSVIGTPLYMAPEQVEGIPDLDPRVDLYALGAIVYELLTGQPAWQRESAVAAAAARLLAPPPDPRALAPDVPEALASLVTRLMARARDDRPRTTAEAAAVFDTIATAATTRPASERPRAAERKKRVAVLPLRTAGDDDHAYLSFAIAEELTDLLTMVDGLAVRPRVNKSIAAASASDPLAAGRRLDVDAVVEGALLRVEGSVHVTLRLITVEDGFQLWARKFVRDACDVLSVADEAAQNVAEAMTARFVLPDRPPVADPVAEELYLRARYLLYRGFAPSLTDTVAVLRPASARQPDDPRIAGLLAVALARAYQASVDPAIGEEAHAAALRAFALDPTRPEARVAVGTIYVAEGDAGKAAVEIAGALRVARSNVDALEAMGRLLLESGEVTEGLRLLDLVLADEEVLIARHSMARAYALLGDWERADDLMARFHRDPGGAPIVMALIDLRFVLWCPDPSRKRVFANRLLELDLSVARRSLLRSFVEAACGDRPLAEVRPLLDTILAGVSGRTRRSVCLRQQLRTEGHMFFGESPAALDALRAADAEQLFDLLWLDRCPLLEPLRRDPGFAEVRANVSARARAVVSAYDRARVRGGVGRAR